jgi:hypothetical protein
MFENPPSTSPTVIEELIPIPPPSSDPQGATEEAQIHRGPVLVPYPSAMLCSPADLGPLGLSSEIAAGEDAGRVSRFAFG